MTVNVESKKQNQKIFSGQAHYAELLFVKKDDFKPNFDTTYSRHV